MADRYEARRANHDLVAVVPSSMLAALIAGGVGAGGVGAAALYGTAGVVAVATVPVAIGAAVGSALFGGFGWAIKKYLGNQTAENLAECTRLAGQIRGDVCSATELEASQLIANIRALSPRLHQAGLGHTDRQLMISAHERLYALQCLRLHVPNLAPAALRGSHLLNPLLDAAASYQGRWVDWGKKAEKRLKDAATTLDSRIVQASLLNRRLLAQCLSMARESTSYDWIKETYADTYLVVLKTICQELGRANNVAVHGINIGANP